MTAAATGESGALQQQQKTQTDQPRDSEEVYRRLVELSFDGIAIHSDGVILFINPAGAELLGAETPDQLIGESILDFLHPDYFPVVQRRIQKVREEGSGVPLTEEKFIRLDGEEVIVEVAAAPTFYEGRPAVQVLFRNVTGRKQMERALRESDRRYRSFVENFQGIAYRSNMDLIPVFFHGAVEEITGFTADDFTAGRARWDQVIHPQDLPGLSTEDKARLRSVSHFSYEREYRILRKDGQIRWVHEVLQNVCDESGKPIMVQGVIYDVTERKRTEEALRASEQEYRTLVEQSLQGLAVLGADGPLFANSALAEMLGYTVEEMLAFSADQLAAIVHPDDQSLVWKRFEDRLAGKSVPQRYEFRMVRKDGEIRWVEMFSNRVEYQGIPAVRAAIVDISERKRLAHEVEERRLYLESVLEYAPDAIVTLDAQHRIQEWNPGAESLFGYTAEEALGQDLDKLITGFDADTFEEAQIFTHHILFGESVPPTETVRYRKDGSPVHVIVAGSPILIQGKVVGVVGVYTDISQYKMAEEALRRYAERLRILRSIDGTILAAWSPEEIAQAALRHVRELVPCVGAGVALFDFDAQLTIVFAIHIDGRAEVKPGTRISMGTLADIQTLRQGKTVVVNEIEDRPEASRMVQALQAAGVHSYIAAPLIAHGELIGALALGAASPHAFSAEHIDITHEVANQIAVALHQARLRAALEAEQQRLGVLVEHLPEGVLLLDSEQRILLANPAAQSSLPALTALAGQSAAGIGDVLTHLGDHPMAELLRSPPDGRWHTLATPRSPRHIFEMVAQPIAVETGVEGWVVLIRDVTEERETQERAQLQERLAAVGQLAGGIAHDFNNLLTTILLYAQLPLSKPGLAPDVARALETILSESRQAAALIQQILDFSRRSPIETQPVDLRPFVNETVRVLQRTIPENISFLQETEVGEYTVNADPTRIQQVLMNLVVNARDAMPDGGVLRIKLAQVAISTGEDLPVTGMYPGQWVCLAVSDTGTGIAPDVLPHIFDPFFTTKPRGKGVGLGLAQVYGVVEQHGGSIGVETQVGHGTTFSVYLPSYQVEKPEIPRNRAGLIAPPTGVETILLVEDNKKLRQAAQEFLDSLGYQVLAAADGQEALAAYRSAGAIDLVITDVVMPTMGGKELIRELRRANPHLKVLAITGHVLAQDLQDLRAEGILDVLYKPIDVDTLAQTVRAVLDQD